MFRNRPLGWLAPLFAWMALAGTMGGVMRAASARPAGPILHEQIPPDPREDLALNASLEGDLPAALETTSGIVPAPDPHALPGPAESTYGFAGPETFAPDRDTRRPDAGSYDDPFTPATAPFKRLHAYDTVGSDYRLYVRSGQRVEVPIGGVPPGPNEDAFFADLVVEAGHDRDARIPSVGPGARIVRANLAVGADRLPFRVTRDSADNWFLQASTAAVRVRARLVMELAIARGTLSGRFGDPSWSDLPRVPPLPANAAREAAAVRSAIGVERSMRPREAIAKLVDYFHSFTESIDSPSGHGSVYLDVALSKKGVCRHRAFAFLITAQSLGVPTRLVTNEAHAWVEVHDMAMWRRVDLGGAAPLVASLAGTASERTAYEQTPDAAGSAQRAEHGAEVASVPWTQQESSVRTPSDDRPPSHVSLQVTALAAHRGQPFPVRGEVRADGEPCPRVAVELSLRAAGTQKVFSLVRVATGGDGVFSDEIVVSAEAPLGDYEVVASTHGDARCGPGTSN